jgi:hypothetical protein
MHFVGGSVRDALPDAHVADGRNLPNRPLERRDERLAFRGRQVRSGLHEHDVGNHGDNRIQPRKPPTEKK